MRQSLYTSTIPCSVNYSHCLDFLSILSLFSICFSYSNLFPSLFVMLLKAIESGRLPGDVLDDIPCKFVDGKLVCEVSHLTTGFRFDKRILLFLGGPSPL